jgi:hypothetical protein
MPVSRITVTIRWLLFIVASATVCCLGAVERPITPNAWEADYQELWWHKIKPGPPDSLGALVPGPVHVSRPTPVETGQFLANEWRAFAFPDSFINVRNGMRLLGPPDKVVVLPGAARRFLWQRPVLVEVDAHRDDQGKWIHATNYFGIVLLVSSRHQVDLRVVPFLLKEDINPLDGID